MLERPKQATKDLLYTTNNKGLDIARLMSLLGCLIFFGLSIWYYGVKENAFDPSEWGLGLAGVFAACAGWIFARQKWEVEMARADRGLAPLQVAPAPEPSPFDFRIGHDMSYGVRQESYPHDPRLD